MTLSSRTVQVEQSENRGYHIGLGFSVIMASKLERQHINNFTCQQFIVVTNNEYKAISGHSVLIQADKHHPRFSGTMFTETEALNPADFNKSGQKQEDKDPLK